MMTLIVDLIFNVVIVSGQQQLLLCIYYKLIRRNINIDK